MSNDTQLSPPPAATRAGSSPRPPRPSIDLGAYLKNVPWRSIANTHGSVSSPKAVSWGW